MRLCVVSQNLDACTETFIRTHLEHLPFEKHTLSNKCFDQADDVSLSQQTVAERLLCFPFRFLGAFDEQKHLVKRQAHWLEKTQISAVLAEYGTSGVKMTAPCELAGVPLIVHFHGYDAHNLDILRAYKDRYRKMFASAAAVVGVSHQMIKKLKELGAPAEKLFYVPYYVDPGQFAANAMPAASSEILSVGRFVEKKAPHLTLLAFSMVLHAVPDATLTMVGDGPLLGPCRWMAKSLGIENSVNFHGVKEHDWVKKAMLRSSVFVQHSVEALNGDCEGTPVAILEAQCSGLPVVATRHTGIQDVVVEGETGFLCDEGDAKTMADKIIHVLTLNAKDQRRISMNSRDRILNKFNKTQTIDRLAEVIRTSANSERRSL